MADIGPVQQRNTTGTNGVPQQSAPVGSPGTRPPHPQLDGYINSNFRALNGGDIGAWTAFGRFAQQNRIGPNEALDAASRAAFGIVGPQQTSAFMDGFRDITGGGRPDGHDPQRFNPRVNMPNLGALALP